MLFRLGKFCLGICFSLALVHDTFAGMTVTSLRRGRTSGTKTYYYTSTTTFPASAVFDTADSSYLGADYLGSVDITAKSTDAAEVTNRTHLLTFTVTTDTALATLAANQVYVLAFQYRDTANGNRLIPIITMNGIACSTSGSGCTDGSATAGGSGLDATYYFGAVFTPGQAVTVGLYASDICRIYQEQGITIGASQPCVNTSPSTPNVTTNVPSVLPLKARIYALTIASGGSAFTTVGASSATPSAVDTTFPVKDSLDFDLHFQGEFSPWTCPSLSAVYTPGDGQIMVETSRFGMTPISSNHAAIDRLIALGNGGAGAAAAPTVGTGYASNPVVGRLLLSGAQPVGGFTNSPLGGPDYLYTVQFLIRDLGGLLLQSGAAGLTACSIGASGPNYVQVTSIQGFLSRSNCFIATAAFGSGDEVPVEMLREFRDRVLLKFSLGEKFVDWYYSWSPWAALWLEEHPVFRFPVLFLLIPLQAAAWMVLHPLVFGVLFIFSFLIMGHALVTKIFFWSKE